MSSVSDNPQMAPAPELVPVQEEEELLPVFANSRSPQAQPPSPILDGIVERLPVDPTVAPVISEVYVSPVEAVPGSGGIAGVTAE